MEYQIGVEDSTSVPTKKELAQEKRRCWSHGCRHKAFLKDWAGWHWCLKHWWYHSSGDGFKMTITKIKLTKFF